MAERSSAVGRAGGLLILAVLAAASAGTSGAASPAMANVQAGPTPNGYAIEPEVTSAQFDRMVDFAMIPGTTDEAVVLSQREALVRRVSLTGAFTPTVYGNLLDRVDVLGNEEGLLSIAFSPTFANDSRVYVYYTSLSCQPGVSRCSRISRFPVINSDMDESVETVVLEIEQLPANERNHNGGRLLFGPDGYLYLSIGDGGGVGDPEATGQDNDDLLGSVLRINVTGQATYTIPPDNPFADGPGGDADELWAYGLRNPWRYSFDKVSGDLWLADVGQGSWEEVEKVVSGGNYGWNCYEGNVAYDSQCTPGPDPFQFPRAVYPHSLGCSVTGGYVYRGASLPEIYGWYVYGDYCSGRIWAVNPADTSLPVQLVDTDFNISSFAELPNGEILVLTFENQTFGDAIYRLTCAATPDTDSDGQGNACDLDDDNDEFSDVVETSAGTDPLWDCGVNAWPPDIDDDTFSDISDITALTGVFGQSVPPAPARYNIAPDPPDGFVDITDVARMTGLFGQSCA